MKAISEFDFIIIMSCKQGDYNNLKETLKKELWLNEIDDRTIYYHLLTTTFKLFNEHQIKNIFNYQLHSLYVNNVVMYQRNNFNYEDLWKLLYQNISDLRLKDKNKDLYQINIKDNLLSYDEYFSYIKEKNNQKQLKK